jgi:hypothetical protein
MTQSDDTQPVENPVDSPAPDAGAEPELGVSYGLTGDGPDDGDPTSVAENAGVLADSEPPRADPGHPMNDDAGDDLADVYANPGADTTEAVDSDDDPA